MDPKNWIAEHLEIATLNLSLPVEDLYTGTETVLGAVLPALGCFTHYCILIAQKR